MTRPVRPCRTPSRTSLTMEEIFPRNGLVTCVLIG